MIKAMGMEEFYSYPENEVYKDKEIPFPFLFVFQTFMEIYQMSKDAVTWTDIDCYCRVRNIKLSQTEIDYIILINRWVIKITNEMDFPTE